MTDALRRVAAPGHPQLPVVDVWLQSGLHYRRVAADAADAGEAPEPGDALPSGGARGFDFFSRCNGTSQTALVTLV